MEIIEPDDFGKSLAGLTIVGAELVDGDGFHFHMSDGRTLVVFGSFVMGFLKVSEVSIQ